MFTMEKAHQGLDKGGRGKMTGLHMVPVKKGASARALSGPPIVMIVSACTALLSLPVAGGDRQGDYQEASTSQDRPLIVLAKKLSSHDHDVAGADAELPGQNVTAASTPGQDSQPSEKFVEAVRSQNALSANGAGTVHTQREPEGKLAGLTGVAPAHTAATTISAPAGETGEPPPPVRDVIALGDGTLSGSFDAVPVREAIAKVVRAAGAKLSGIDRLDQEKTVSASFAHSPAERVLRRILGKQSFVAQFAKNDAGPHLRTVQVLSMPIPEPSEDEVSADKEKTLPLGRTQAHR